MDEKPQKNDFRTTGRRYATVKELMAKTPHRPRHELRAITDDWPVVNQRRSVLIDKEYEGKITDAELKELGQLQKQASLRRQLLAPYPMDELRQERERLKREGKWDK